MKWTLTVISAVLLISMLFLPSTSAEDYMRWELPEGAKMRFGKGQIKSYQFSPDNTRLAVMSSIGIWLYDVRTGKAIKLLAEHTHAVFSPDWQMFVKKGKDENTIELWDLHTVKLKATFEGPTARMGSVVFSPDSKMLAASDSTGTIWLWDIASGKHKNILTPHENVSKVMFSPDGQTIMSQRRKHRSSDFRLWNITTGEFKAQLEDTTLNDNINFNPDGTLLYGAKRNELRLWDPDTGKIKMRLGIESAYRHLVFSPDGQTIANARWSNSSVALWNPHTGKLKNTLIGDPKYVKGIMISNGIPKLVDYPTNPVTSIAFSPHGHTLAVSSRGKIVLWDPEIGEQKITLIGKDNFRDLLFSSDGRVLAARNRSEIYLWHINTDIRNSALRHTISGYSSEVNSIAFSPDARKLASGHEYSIRLWNTTSGQFQVLNSFHLSRVQSVAFSPNGKTLASLGLTSTSDSKGEIFLWDAVAGEYQVTLKGHGKVPDNWSPNRSGLAFSPNGEILATGSSDRTVRLWDAKTTARDSFFHGLWGDLFGHDKATLKGHTYHVLSVAFSPDGQTLASGSSDKTVRIWDVRRRKLKATLEGHVGKVGAIAFSPDGQTLASGGGRGILLWDPITAEHKATLMLMWNPDTLQHKATLTEAERLSLPIPKVRPPGQSTEIEVPPDPIFHAVGITSLAFSPDGKTLACAGRSGTIALLDMSTLQVKQSFSGHGDWVNSVAFSPDEQTLASGSEDRTILIWELKP